MSKVNLSMGISEGIEDATISAEKTKISRLTRRCKNSRDQIEYQDIKSVKTKTISVISAHYSAANYIKQRTA